MFHLTPQEVFAKFFLWFRDSFNVSLQTKHRLRLIIFLLYFCVMVLMYLWVMVHMYLCYGAHVLVLWCKCTCVMVRAGTLGGGCEEDLSFRGHGLSRFYIPYCTLLDLARIRVYTFSLSLSQQDLITAVREHRPSLVPLPWGFLASTSLLTRKPSK